MKIKLADIAVPLERMRNLRSDVVTELAESIEAQLCPIIVRPKPRGGRRYNLIAGRQLEALRSLGWQTTPATVLDDLDVDAALLVEINENLIRAELSPAERALHLGRRKELYEKLHPETKPTTAGGPGRAKTRRQNGDDNGRALH